MPKCCRTPPLATWVRETWVRRWPSWSGPGRSTRAPTSRSSACPRSTTTSDVRRTARRRLQPHCWCARVTSTRSEVARHLTRFTGKDGRGPGGYPICHRVGRSRAEHRGALRGIPGDLLDARRPRAAAGVPAHTLGLRRRPGLLGPVSGHGLLAAWRARQGTRLRRLGAGAVEIAGRGCSPGRAAAGARRRVGAGPGREAGGGAGIPA